jgi:pimeloyl-ACP methyl ester carboxylesterase
LKTYLNCIVLSLLMALAVSSPAMAQDEPPDAPAQPAELPTEQPTLQSSAEEVPGDMPDAEAASVLEAAPPPDPFARDTYRIDPVVCPFKGQIDYEPGDIECGLLQVPENREDPDSRFIELHFVKLNSRWGKDEDEDADEEEEAEEDEDSGLAPGKREDPVIYLTGGPGAHVTYYVKRFKDHGLLDHRDLYILEQRGIGASQDFCPFYSGRKPAIDNVPTFDESLAAQLERVADCARNASAAGVDLSAYNTIENARDVKALRRALGFEQWNVWGISYGSILGQAYLKEDPEAILAFVIDAIMPLDIRESELYWRVAHWYDRDLRKLQEICDRQPACAKHYPDIGGKLREAIQSVVDNPIEVEVKDIENYPSGKARIFQDVVAFLPFTFFYEQDNYPGIPGLVYAWAEAVLRREEVLFQALASDSGDAGFGGGSQGMANAIICIDGDAEAQARAGKKDIQEYPVLGPAIATAESWDRRAALCAELGMDQRPPGQYLPVQTDLPGLVIEGDMDPITPPANAQAIMPGLRNATYVEFPYAGHGPSRSVKCAGDMLNKFYDDPTAKPDLSCVGEMEEPKLYAPLYTSTVVPRLLVLLADDKKKLALPAAWAGSSVLVSLIAFLVLSFRPLARWIDARPPEKPAARAGAVRLVAWLSATVSVAAVAIIAAAIALTAKTSELLPVFGFVPWARWGAWLGLAAGVLGLLTVVVALGQQRLPRSRILGFALTGLAALSLAVFLFSWDLGPF